MEKKELTVGSEVQLIDYSGKSNPVKDGVIISITLPLRMKPQDWWNTKKYSKESLKDMTTFATVTWDNGKQESLDMEELEPKDSELERQFRDMARVAIVEINKKLDVASKALNEAVAISEEYGVPFYSYISFISQSYYANSLEKKFGKLDDELINSVTNAHSEHGYGGWQHSAVC